LNVSEVDIRALKMKRFITAVAPSRIRDKFAISFFNTKHKMEIIFQHGLAAWSPYRVARFFLVQRTNTGEKNPKWPQNIPTTSVARPSKIYTHLDFLFENKPSDNPGAIGREIESRQGIGC
jgi:hypothetical protein